jgi:hypothetical protein
VRFLERDVAHYEQKIAFQKDETDTLTKQQLAKETQHRQQMWEVEMTFQRDIITLRESLQAAKKAQAEAEKATKRANQLLADAKRK